MNEEKLLLCLRVTNQSDRPFEPRFAGWCREPSSRRSWHVFKRPGMCCWSLYIKCVCMFLLLVLF